MELRLERLWPKETYTIGRLYINNEFFCNTLEDKIVDKNKNGIFDNGEKKVYGESAIPYGTYNIIYWGYPNYYNTTDAYIADPILIVGEELHGTSLGLRKVPADTVCYPVHDLVYGTQSINIGEEELQAHLRRASAALDMRDRHVF
mgnify:CR=1 FL=1